MFVVFDLDGTLANDSHRRHFVEQRPRDYASYHAGISQDPSVGPLVELSHMLIASRTNRNRVEIWTGRPEEFREETEAWLWRIGASYSKLLMRPDDQRTRPVNEIKGEWLETHGRPDLIFDDRDKGVEFWRSKGLLCVQVKLKEYMP